MWAMTESKLIYARKYSEDRDYDNENAFVVGIYKGFAPGGSNQHLFNDDFDGS